VGRISYEPYVIIRNLTLKYCSTRKLTVDSYILLRGLAAAIMQFIAVYLIPEVSSLVTRDVKFTLVRKTLH